jgi:hypothetical protein
MHTWTGQYNKELSAVYGNFYLHYTCQLMQGKVLFAISHMCYFPCKRRLRHLLILDKTIPWIGSPTNSASSILMREIDLDYCHLAVQLLIWLARAWTQIYALRFSVLVLWRFAPLSTVCM